MANLLIFGLSVFLGIQALAADTGCELTHAGLYQLTILTNDEKLDLLAESQADSVSVETLNAAIAASLNYTFEVLCAFSVQQQADLIKVYKNWSFERMDSYLDVVEELKLKLDGR